MAFVVVNQNGEEWVFEDRPYSVNGYWETTGALIANKIPKGSIRKLIGKDMSFKDKPVQLSLEGVYAHKRYDINTEKWYSPYYKVKPKGYCFVGIDNGCIHRFVRTQACTCLIDYRQNRKVIWLGDKVYDYTADAISAYLNSIFKGE